MNHSELTNFIWNIANLIRDHYRRSKYPDVILPFTVLRRLDCVLAETKEDVLTAYDKYQELGTEGLDQQLRRASGFVFYNISLYDFDRLLEDSDAIYANTINYLNGFSDNMREVIDNFKLRATVETLHDAGLLYQVLKAFSHVDLHPDKVSNHQMGTIFEELIRRFNEASNENPGEHFTPRDVVHLMARLLLASDDAFIQTPGRIVKVYDPCCGSGGMLTITQDHVRERNPTARVYVFGQEVNPETYAICKSDLYIKSPDGRDAEGIRQGSSLSNPQHRGEHFHYLITNPPYGKDWRIDKDAVEKEAALGHGGRFGAGTPRISDGQLLFLQHMLAHRYDPAEDHSRVAIIMNGSPLFTGDAGSGESEIRRWILENDWLEAIIALPEQLFYNTGIATYVWILTNHKPPERVDQVQLIDASDLWKPRRKSLGDKRRDISPEQRVQIVQLYQGATHLRDADDEVRCTSRVKTFDRREFGFRKIRVERPLRLNFATTPERIACLDEERAFAKLAKSRKRKPEAKAAAIAAGKEKQAAIKAMLADLPQERYMDQAAFLKDVKRAAKSAGIKLLKPLRMAIRDALGEVDPDAAICRDSKGRPEPNTDLRDYERVPLTENVADYVAREILPHVPDAWVDPDYADEHDGQPGRVGYEINFNRYFYTYEPPRPLEAIQTDIQAAQDKLANLLHDLF